MLFTKLRKPLALVLVFLILISMVPFGYAAEMPSSQFESGVDPPTEESPPEDDVSLTEPTITNSEPDSDSVPEDTIPETESAPETESSDHPQKMSPRMVPALWDYHPVIVLPGLSAAPRKALCCLIMRTMAITLPSSIHRLPALINPMAPAPPGQRTSRIWAGILPGMAVSPMRTIRCTALNRGAAMQPAPPATPLTGT